jgi:hypothetical protein
MAKCSGISPRDIVVTRDKKMGSIQLADFRITISYTPLFYAFDAHLQNSQRFLACR